jgi:hypothetical protein
MIDNGKAFTTVDALLVSRPFWVAHALHTLVKSLTCVIVLYDQGLPISMTCLMYGVQVSLCLQEHDHFGHALFPFLHRHQDL